MKISEQLLRLRLNLDIYCEPILIERTLEYLDSLVRYLKGRPEVSICKKTIENPSRPMRYVILDFEGYFPKLFGILICNRIYQFYIEQEIYQQQLYQVLAIVLRLFKAFYIISFSGWEARFISILKYRLLEVHRPEILAFLDELQIIDIQQKYFESMTAGLFSINEKVLPDPVLRISDNVDMLFEMGYLDLIIEHNDNCLLSTLTLLHKRFFKLNLLESTYNQNNLKKFHKYRLIIYLPDNQKIIFEFME